MTNQNTSSTASRQRRYTVSRLLELAPQLRPINFDLSKFTYDAARAGVVPPLGACVMSNRRASSDRPRGWSQESGSSQEEVIVFQGNRPLKAPERQPTVPPTEPRVQQDEGFARFLKKHSSPTHQRVTTGGRIVPMEPQHLPPVFALRDSSQANEDHKNNVHEAGKPSDKPVFNGFGQAKVVVTDNNIHHPQPQPFIPVATGTADALTFSAASNLSVMATGNMLRFDATHLQPDHVDSVPSAPYYASMAGDPYSMMAHPQMFQANAMPLTGMNGALLPVMPIPCVANPYLLNLPPSFGMTTTPTGAHPPTEAYAEQMLNNSIMMFRNLDEQLKELDRHRAMTELDPYVRDQRVAIVHLRSEAKSQITYWSEQAGRDPQNVSKNMGVAPTSRLNVQANAYIPLRTHQSTDMMPTVNDHTPKVNGIDKAAGKPDFVVDSTRRPIPIVPPPGKLPSPPKNEKAVAPTMDESVAVDEWGVHLGAAPPGIQQQQTQMLKDLVRQASISPPSSNEQVGMYSPHGPHVYTPPTQPNEVEVVPSDALFECQSEWLPTNPGRAPPTVEACYEVQLDAMRLPTGVTTKVRMPDGAVTEVRGCGLKRPPSFEMDDFEQRYWMTKPTLTREMFDNFVELHGIGGVKDPANLDHYLEIKAFIMNSNIPMEENDQNGSSSSKSNDSNKDLGYKATNASDAPQMVHGAGFHGYASRMDQSSASRSRMSASKLSSASSPPVWSRAEDRPGWFANDYSRNSRLAGSEALSSKGFSSVSVQNVHAMGRLPHVDGPSDGQRLSALSLLSAASKAASPQATQYAGLGFENSYEPYPGEVRGTTVVSDDVFQPRSQQEKDM